MESIKERFWSKVDIGKPGECWEWKAGALGVGKARMGRFSALRHIPGITRSAPRWSWILTHGEIPDGLNVLHKCDNRMCVNPHHLFLGTASDNSKDMVRKGRSFKPKGTLHPGCKLTESQVKRIRKDPRIQRKIAEEYGVTQRTISLIKRKERWTHI